MNSFPSIGAAFDLTGSELPVTEGTWQRGLWTGGGGHSHFKEGGALPTGVGHPGTLQHVTLCFEGSGANVTREGQAG